MKNIFAIFIALSIMSCHDQKPTYSYPGDIQTLDQITAFYDSVYALEQVDTFATAYPYTVQYPENYPPANIPSQHTGNTPVTDPDTIDWDSYDLEADSPDSTDQMNTVLGVTDVTFVWEGDTCSTSMLGGFLLIFEDNCLTGCASEVKTKVVNIMAEGFISGTPTYGVILANSFLEDALPCGGLSDYAAYYRNCLTQ